LRKPITTDKITFGTKFQPPTSKGAYTLFEQPTTTFKTANDLVEVNGTMIPR
jgi:hypothetical protein